MIFGSVFFDRFKVFRQLGFHLWVLTALCLFFVLAVSPVSAQAPEAPKASDVRIVIDISGSMKKNDPQNLRRPALDMLVKLLPEGSKGGVWTFGQYVNMLVKHREVDSAWKAEADSKASRINSIAQFTNIGEALEKVAYDKDYSTKEDFQTHVILLTDGMVDINRDPSVNAKERQRILSKILPDYQLAGYRIHTVSLSDKADKQLMDRLALGTDGKSVVAKTADELMNVFLEVFDQAVPKEEVPFDNNSFATDSSIEEFTALIFRQPNSPETKLISPDNTEYNQSTNDPTVNWYRTDKYDLITVKQPLEGEWRVLAEIEPQSRITVVSDLSLAVKSLPSNIMQNETIDLSFALREENKIIKRAEFLDILDIDLEINNKDKNTSSTKRLSDGLVPGNGVYQRQLDEFKELGQYDIIINLDGKTFQRRFSHNVTVREPFAVHTTTEDKNGSTIFTVMVVPQDKDINLEKTQVVGNLKEPDGTSNIVNFNYSENQQWELAIKPKQKGEYSLSFRITQVGERGKVSDIVPNPLSFSYPLKDESFELLLEPEPELIAEPEIVIEEVKKPQPKPDAKKETETREDFDSEELMDEEEDTGISNWILYSALAVVNILIILIIYILYRKLFGRKKSNTDAEVGEDVEIEQVTASEPSMDAVSEPEASAFEEPPMDEMMIDDLDEDIDLAEETLDETDINLDTTEAAKKEEIMLDADLIPDADDNTLSEDAALVDDSSFVEDSISADDSSSVEDSSFVEDSILDEDPEFSLDDFAPDELDDEDLDEKK